LLSFIDPEAHPDVSYQLLQSLYGLGNGGWFGVGLGQSRAKWSYLPNADSDFIFAIIGEELGLIGAGIVLLLFALLAYTGLRIARRNVDPFVKIVASAGTVWLVGQAAINIGYVVGLLPVTGIPLPMISSGGTSLLITMVVFGLLANFARREPQAAAALQAGGGGRLAQFLGMRPPDPAAKAAKAAEPRRRPGSRAADPRAGRRGPAQPKAGRDRPGQRNAARPVPGQPRRPDPRPDDPRRRQPPPVAPRAADPRSTGQRSTDPRSTDRHSGRPPAAKPRGAAPGTHDPREPRRWPGRRGGA
jgi:cell division protein FtsW